MVALAAETVLVVGTLALFAIVGYKLLVGEINTDGMLSDKTTGQLSQGRLQLLLVTIGGATFYLFEILSAGESGAMPPVPEVLLWTVGASNAGYLGGKVYSSLWAKPRGG